MFVPVQCLRSGFARPIRSIEFTSTPSRWSILYNDGDDFYFMDQNTYEQTALKHDTLGDAVEYLTPNLLIEVSFHDGKAVGIELPTAVEMTVIETEPGIKSATASSVTKPAKLETGLVVQVPPFINEGEKIRIDTAEGTYMSRA
jgi:elongation factor P